MPYLIDGHNLIAHMPDISLSDPDDEGKLVVRLRGFAAARRKQCIVIFDHGLPGGKSPMSNDTVKVIFATAYHSNADKILMERIRNTPDASNWTVVSSDNEVLTAARQKGMKGMKSAEFSALLPDLKAKPLDPGESVHPHISSQHVETMLDEFQTGELAQEPPPATVKPASYSLTNPPVVPQKPAVPSKTPRPPLSKPATPGTPPSSLMDKFEEVTLSDSEIDSWLSVFEASPPVAPTPAVPKVTLQPALPDDSIGTDEEIAPLPPPSKAGGQTDVRKMRVDDWMTYFGVDDAPPPLVEKPADPEKIRARFVEHDRSVDANAIPREDMDLWLRAFSTPATDKDAEESPPPAPNNKPRRKHK